MFSPGPACDRVQVGAHMGVRWGVQVLHRGCCKATAQFCVTQPKMQLTFAFYAYVEAQLSWHAGRSVSSCRWTIAFVFFPGMACPWCQQGSL